MNKQRPLVGKTARLPALIREQLNRRLHDGQPASLILPWLNSLAPVPEILARHASVCQPNPAFPRNSKFNIQSSKFCELLGKSVKNARKKHLKNVQLCAKIKPTTSYSCIHEKTPFTPRLNQSKLDP